MHCYCHRRQWSSGGEAAECCGKLQIIPSLERLPFLTKFVLRNMLNVTEVSIPSLEELLLDEMPKLERCSCTSLRDLSSSLRVLKVMGCPALKVFPLFGDCQKFKIEQKSWLSSLGELIIRKCPRLLVPHPLPPSTSVSKLSIYRVSTLPWMEGSSSGKLRIGLPEDFDEIIDEHSDELRTLDGKMLSFHNLRFLTHLTIRGCRNLTSISFEGLRQLISLKSLGIWHCRELFSSHVLPEDTHEDMAAANCNILPSLERLCIESCGIAGKWLSLMLHSLSLVWESPSLEYPQLHSCTALEELAIIDCKSLASLEGLQSLGNLKALKVDTNPSLKSLQLHSCTALENLEISDCKSFTSLEGLQSLGNLKALKVDGSPSLEYLQLHSCTALENLEISDCESLASLEGLQSLGGLRCLEVYCCPGLSLSRQGYELCPRLERLEMLEPSALTTSFCKHLTSLLSLGLRFPISSRDVMSCLTDEQEEALQLLTSLQELKFVGFKDLHLPAGLHSLRSLKRLRINYCRGILRLPEKGLPPSLEQLDISGCSKELKEYCELLATSKLKVDIYA